MIGSHLQKIRNFRISLNAEKFDVLHIPKDMQVPFRLMKKVKIIGNGRLFFRRNR
jgi:hypothetical protein